MYYYKQINVKLVYLTNLYNCLLWIKWNRLNKIDSKNSIHK